MFTISFWKDTFSRAIATAAEAALALLGTSTLIESVGWKAVGSTAALAFIVTVIKCIAATAGLKKGTPEDLAKGELDDEDLKTIMKEEAEENEGN